jgi:hypothetical protein
MGYGCVNNPANECNCCDECVPFEFYENTDDLTDDFLPNDYPVFGTDLEKKKWECLNKWDIFLDKEMEIIKEKNKILLRDIEELL